jgi:hypothetical protein
MNGGSLLRQPLFGGWFPKLNLRPSTTKYSHLKNLGNIPKCKQYPKGGMNYVEDYSKDFQNFCKENPTAWNEIFPRATYRKVRATLKGVTDSINKIDKPAINPNDWIEELAEEYAWRHMKVALTQEMQTEEVDIVMSTSPGIPFVWDGLFSKAAALKSALLKKLREIDYQAIYATYDKVEFLDLEDLRRGKVRTMFGPDVIELMWQKIFFDNQNQGIIDGNSTSWIKYGMVKQYGGFDKLCKDIEEYSLRAEGDASGWDRTADMAGVYRLRLRGLYIPPGFFLKLTIVVENIIHSVVILPNGDVIICQTGNRSGTNNTASDNSLKHLIIKFYQLIFMRIEKGLEVPTYEECLEYARVAIYSDDFIMSVCDVFFPYTKEEFRESMIEVYRRFGIAMKESATVITHETGRLSPDHSFLGSYARWNEFQKQYIPYPRMGKICSSLVFAPLNPISKFDMFTRTLNLAVLAYPDEIVFNIIISYAKWQYSSLEFPDQVKADDFLDSVSVDLDDRQSFLSVVTGRERR